MKLVLEKKLLLLRMGGFAGLLAGLAALAGCGSGSGTVSGTVTYKGKALTSGNVQIRSQAGSVFATEIKSDGTYSLSGVPAGAAQVAVSAMDPKFEEKMREQVGAKKLPGAGDRKIGRAVGGGGAPPVVDRAAYSLIPLTYESFDTSKLTVDVKRGETKRDIPLE